jgi:non-ribosomal peptide synthetase component F/acyl carrier protein
MTLTELLTELSRQGITLWADNDKLRVRGAREALSPTLRAELAQHKPDLLAFLRGNRSASVQQENASLPLASRQSELPLSSAQEEMWLADQFAHSDAAYKLSSAYRLSGQLNIAALEHGLHEMLLRHEILRTTFTVNARQKPIQVVHSTASLASLFKIVNLRHYPTDEQQESAIRQCIHAEEARQFDTSQGPLMRINLLHLRETEYILHIVAHHIIFDIWSLNIFLKELAILYSASHTQKLLPLPPLSVHYADFAVWQRSLLSSTQGEEQLAYWRQQLAYAPALLELPLDHPRPAVRTFQGQKSLFHLPVDLARALRGLSQEEGTTLFMLLLAAFQTLLYRYSGQKDILVGSPTSGRIHPDTTNMPGSFAYPLILRAHLDGQQTFRELLTQVRTVVLEAYAHQDIPFSKVIEAVQPERNARYSPLFQVMFTFPPVPEQLTFSELEAYPIEELQAYTSNYDLVLGMTDNAEKLDGIWIYNRNLFDDATIEQMQGRFQVLLERISADPDQALSTIPLLAREEERQLLPQPDRLPVTTCIHHAFEQQAERKPEACAILVCDAQSRIVTTCTYHELNLRSNLLAFYLLHSGIKPGQYVGIVMERSTEMVIAMLGVLKAGCAFVLSQPEDPPELTAANLQRANIVLVLTQTHLHPQLPMQDCPVVAIDDPLLLSLSDESEIHKHPEKSVSVQQPAYLHFIADSGMIVDHQGLSARLQRLLQHCTLAASVVLHSSLQPETLITEIFLPLACGGRIIIATEDDPEISGQLIPSQHVDTAFFTPIELFALLNVKKEDTQAASTLSTVFCDGERLHSSVVQAFYKQYPTATLYHTYTPAAAVSVVALYHCSPTETREIIPVGQRDGLAYVLLDEEQNPVPGGMNGEIYVYGEGMACGYLPGNSNADSYFIEKELAGLPRQRLLKTGDKGRVLADNTLEICGSMARHAWIKGVRVDLDFIETTLLMEVSIVDGVVLTHEKTPLDEELIAYVVSTSPQPVKQISAYLQKMLPTSMLPAGYVPLTALPLTTAGHVDEAALLRMSVIDPDLILRWQGHLQAQPGIQQVAVVTCRSVEELPPLHVLDILPRKEQPELQNGTHLEIQRQSPEARQQGEQRPLALCDGGPLLLDGQPTTLAETLRTAALMSAETGITFIQPDKHITFQSYTELLQEAEKLLTGLRQAGLQPQDTVLFQFERNHDFLLTFWSCILGGFIPIPVAVAPSYEERNSSTSKLFYACQMFERPVILCSETLAPTLHTWAAQEQLSQVRILAIDTMRTSLPSYDWHQNQPQDTALIMLTSGSTGQPKGVELSHHNLICRSAGSRQMHHFSDQEITLNWMPLDHVAGLIYFHLRDVFLGCQQIQAATTLVLQDPLLWLDWIDRYHVTITFAPNFAFGLVNDHAEEMRARHWDLSSLHFLLNGAEAIVARTARRFLQLLHPFGLSTTAMYPAWGMSETSSGIIYSDTFSLVTTSDDDEFVDVGVPIPGLALRLVDSQQQIVEETVIGRLQVRGLTVTRGYYQNPTLNQQVFTDDGWFDTGDLGYLRAGRLTITGREKDVIVINSVNYYSHEIESLVETLDGIETSYTAACGVSMPGSNTDKLAIFFHAPTFQGHAVLNLIKEIRGKVVRAIGINPEYLIPVEKASIPKTEIGKIQHAQLKQQFEAGQFVHICKQLDILSANMNTIPDWFYRKVWNRKELRASLHTRQKNMLLFLDNSGPCSRLYEQLRPHLCTCICVEAGTTFSQEDDEHYHLDPTQPAHYAQLFASLAHNHRDIDCIIHLWSFGPYQEKIASVADLELAQEQGVLSLFSLVQALAQAQKAPAQKTMQLTVISSYIQSLEPGDEIAYEKSPIAGLLRSVPLELPWLHCKHIDFPADEIALTLSPLLKDLFTSHDEPEVAYRQGQRYVTRIRKVAMQQEATQPIPFKQGGMYLLSGGLGGIGTDVASYLLQHYHARLLLIGRTPLEDSEIHQQRWQTLVEAGGEVRYAAVDICNPELLTETVDQAQASWHAELDGILHLADTFQERPLIEETYETFQEALRAKVLGTWVLHQLAVKRPGCLFSHFASVNGSFGGSGAAAYGAANRFLEHMAMYQRNKLSMRSYCFSWSMWDETGMSQGYHMKGLVRARGYCLVKPAEGLLSYLAGLYHDQPALLIGLDGNNASFQRVRETHGTRIQHVLRAYFTASDPLFNLSRQQKATFPDRFGVPTTCEYVQISEMPFLPNGEINEGQLEMMGQQSQQQSTHTAPSSEIERKIAAIWQEILHLDRVGINDNFFELGGHSILVAQVHGKLQETFQRNFMMVELIKYPTIAALAKFLGPQDNASSLQTIQSRVEERKASRQRQSQIRQSYQQQKKRREVSHE